MATEPFSLDELIPETMTARLSGRVYDVRMVAHLGPAEYARMLRLQERMKNVLRDLGSDDVEVSAQAAEDIADAADRLMALLIPDLTDEQIAAMTFGKKSAFIDYWRSRQEVKPATGKAKAGDRPIRGRRSSALSTLVTTRNAS